MTITEGFRSAPSIVEFLLLRIAEDEATASLLAKGDAGHSPMTQVYTGMEWVTTPLTTDRLLAECKAKRAIMKLHAPVRDEGWKSGAAHDWQWCGSCGSIDDSPEPYPCDTLKAIAAVYVDHPGYDPEWAR
ncbi:MAG TPA: DUF6221 family protein [Arthrobacter sp.]|jgi:hypothetical protein